MMSSPAQSRRNNFNLLRFILAVLVILAHSPELVDGNRSREILTSVFHTLTFGEFAVDGFFLLSGYLIVQSWVNNPSISAFLRSRILRIFPAFIVASLACAFVVGPLASDPSAYFSAFWIGGFVKGMLLLQPPVVPPVFAGTQYPVVNGAMWTISLEFACYLVVLVAGVVSILRRRSSWLVLTLLIVAGFAVQRSGWISTTAFGGIFSHPFFRLGSFFMTGGCFYLFREFISYTNRYSAVAAAVLIVGMFSPQLAELSLLIAGGYLLFYLAFKPIAGLSSFNMFPDVSYGVYLYGWPVQKLVLWALPLISPWLLFFLSFLGALFLGIISWYAVEKPFLKFKQSRLPDSLRAGRLSGDAG